jgi:hypothetical protein
MRRILALTVVMGMGAAGCSSKSSSACSSGSATSGYVVGQSPAASVCPENLPPAATVAFTINGASPCDPLNPALNKNNASHNGATSIQFSSSCQNGGGNFQIVFQPTPAPGGQAPCTALEADANSGQSVHVSCVKGGSGNLQGTVTVNGTVDNYTIDGSCQCGGSQVGGSATVTFSGVRLE